MTGQLWQSVSGIAVQCLCRPNRFWRSDVRSTGLQNGVLKLHVFDALVIFFPAHALLLFQGSMPLRLPAPQTRPIPLDVGHDSGKWGTIPLQPKKCPTSQRNPAPHRNGTLPHFKWNQCPTSTGIRRMRHRPNAHATISGNSSRQNAPPCDPARSFMTTSASASRSASAHLLAFSRKNGSCVPATRYVRGSGLGIMPGGL
jgi:hypothetical protein